MPPAPAPVPPSTVRIRDALSFGLRTVFFRPGAFVDSVWPFFLLSLVNSLASISADEGFELGPVTFVIDYLLSSLFILYWSRRLLLEDSGFRPGIAHFGAFFLRMMALGAIVALPLLLGMTLILSEVGAGTTALGGLVVVIGTALATYVAIGFLPVLPSAAIGQPLSFGDAWRLTAGCRVRAWLGTILIGTVVVMPGNLLSMIVVSSPSALMPDPATRHVVSFTVVAYLQVAVQAGFAAGLYRQLVGRDAAPPKAAG